jgi:hypothetical protein
MALAPDAEYSMSGGVNKSNALQVQRSRFIYRELSMRKDVVVSDNNQRAASGRRAQRNSYALYTTHDSRLQPFRKRKFEECDLRGEMIHGRVCSIGETK